MRRTLIWVVLLALMFALAIVASRENGGALAAMNSRDYAWLLTRIIWLVVVGSAVIAIFRGNFTQAIRSALIWLVIALVLLVGYTYRFELLDTFNRVLAELVPGHTVTNGRTVELTRGQTGEFSMSTEVNGKRVGMVLDTGASAVVLTNDAAKAAGLPLEMIKYTVSVDTANGQTRAAAVTLDRLAVGGIVERAVPALVAQPGQLRTSLLGMSFLNRLQSWEVRGDRLLMRGYP